MSRCRSCRAPIRWAVTAAGAKMPLDAEPNPAGNVRLHRPEAADPLAVVCRPQEAEEARRLGFGDQLYMPHHATCPKASKHRRRAS